jgi:hypothetical protein
MGGKVKCRWATALRAAAFGASLIGGLTAAYAGSDNSSNTWAGDVNGIALPPGTFLAIDYTGYRHSDEFVANPNNILSRLGNPNKIASTGEVFTDITRFVYFTSLFDRPFVIEAAVPYVNIDKVNIGNLPSPTASGLGPQTLHSGVDHPVFFLSNGLIVQPQMERFLALTNYFFLPMEFGTFDKFAQVNSSNPGQFTWVPQLSYAEGLGKYVPGLRNFWVDVIANASIHTDGDSPFAIKAGPLAGTQFDKLTQDNSYDIKAFLRYNYTMGGLVAVGIEKSWGGNQIASGGFLGNSPFSPFRGGVSLGADDFLKGHIQAVYPVMPDLHVGVDITHDFDRSGGLKEDITAEVRVTKFWIPSHEPLK